MSKYKRNKVYIKLIELTPLLTLLGSFVLVFGFIAIGLN